MSVSRRAMVPLTAASMVLFALVVTQTATAARVVLPRQIGSPGAAAGQLGAVGGLAVNTSAIGRGDIYEADSRLDRVEQFSEAGEFIRLWGAGVISGGATGTGSLTAGSTQVESVVTTTKAFLEGQFVSGPGIPAGTTITAVTTGVGAASQLTLSQAATASGVAVPLTAKEGPGNVPTNERQVIAVSAGASGDFALEFRATSPTEGAEATIAVGASATEVEAALAALADLGSGNVAVTGDAGGPYTVEFKGARFADTNVAPLTVVGQPAGGSVTVTTVQEGAAAFEICTAECVGGTSSAAAGGMQEPGAIAVDPATGNVYVGDQGNRRIDVFAADGSFQGAFGWRVIAGDGAAEEPQFCTVATGCQAGLAGGKGGQLGGTATSIRSLAVTPPSSPHPGDIVIGDTPDNRLDEFSVTLNPADEVVGADFVKAVGWDVVEAGGPGDGDQIENVVVKASAGKFTLSFAGETTAALPFDASAADVQGALESLSAIGAGNVRVEGGPGDPAGADPYGIVFTGALAGRANGPVSASSSEAEPLEGPGAVEVPAAMNPGGVAQFEVCASADACKPGLGGPGAGQLSVPGIPEGIYVAVDPTGAVYALARPQSACRATNVCRVQRFSPSGLYADEFAEAMLRSITATAKLKPFQVAVDPETGFPSVVQEAGATGRWKILEFDSSGALLGVSPPNGSLTITPAGFALAPKSIAYLSAGGRISVLGPTPPPTTEMVSVGEVTTTSATFTGRVTIPEPGGPGYETSYHFEYSADGVHWTDFPTYEVELPSNAAGTYEVQQTASGLDPNTDYTVRLVAQTATPAASPSIPFKTEATGPLVTPTSSTVHQAEATLTALVNPRNSPTTYHVEWATQAEYERGEYGHRLPSFERQIGSGSHPIRIEEALEGLQSNAEYHFRVIATNATTTTTGPDQHFTTLDAAGLPENRALELVTAADKGPIASVGTFTGLGTLFQASASGEALAYSVEYGYPDATAGGSVWYQAGRSPDGWDSTQLSPAATTPPYSAGNSESGFYQYFSSDLDCAVLSSNKPLTADAPSSVVDHGGYNLFRRNADGSYTALSNLEPSNPGFHEATSANYYEVAGASPGCTRVVFHTGFEYPGIGASGLYEWDEGTLRNVGVLPDGTVAVGAEAGAGINAGSVLGDVSADGTRVVFTAIQTEPGAPELGRRAVFERQDGTSTVNVSRSATSVPDLGAGYQLASSDASRIFFLANYGLTAQTSAGPQTAANCWKFFRGREEEACDLYEYDAAAPEGERLTDLSVDTADSGGAVVAGVLGASADGRYVYFAAQGQLVPGEGGSAAQNRSQHLYNVYLSEPGTEGARKLSFVGPVSTEDLESGAAGVLVSGTGRTVSAYGFWGSRVTPDGRHLLFASTADVTGYESGGVAEAYLYAADSNATICLSCRPDGRPSVGESVGGTATAPTFADQSKTGTSRLAPLPILGAGGDRVIFTMPDALAVGAVEGEANLYEWRDGQIYTLASNPVEGGGGPSAAGIVGASADGRDIFVRTRRRLLPQDDDNKADIYDIRVGGGLPSPPAPPVPCDPLVEGACQAAAPAGAAPLSPATVGPPGPGNVNASPPKKARRRGKKHRKHASGHHHRRSAHHKEQKPKQTKRPRQGADRRHGGAK